MQEINISAGDIGLGYDIIILKKVFCCGHYYYLYELLQTIFIDVAGTVF